MDNVSNMDLLVAIQELSGEMKDLKKDMTGMKGEVKEIKKDMKDMKLGIRKIDHRLKIFSHDLDDARADISILQEQTN